MLQKCLHDLVNTHTEWKGGNSLTEQKIRRIAASARAAIRIHAKTGNVDLLRKDLRNGPYHVFGDHRNCNEEFCSSKRASRKADCETLIIKTSTDGESSSNTVETKDAPNYSDATNTDDRAQIFQMVKEIEEEADDKQSMLAEEEEARKGGQYMIDKLPHGLFAEILNCGNRIISISRQLIQNCTTNSAEIFMGINAKFNGGKQINHNQKGSFEGRFYSAGLCFQAGPSWHGKIWEKSTGIESSVIMKDYCHRVYRKRKADRERQNSEPAKKRRRQSKVKKK